MRIPVLFEFTASLLVDLLFYVEFALVKDGDVVGKDSDFNLRPFCAIKRWLPPLDKQTRYHDIIPRFYQVNQVVFQDDNGWSRNDAWLKSLIDFLNLDLLVVFVLGCAMNWNKETIVALPNRRTHVHHAFGPFRLSATALFHFDNHLLERIWFFFHLPSTDRRQEESWVLIYIWLGCIDLAARFTGKVFLCLSILDCLSAHYCAVDDHVFVDVALTHVSDWAQSDFLERWYVSQSNINSFFDLHELFNTLILLIGNELWLNSYEALLEKLQELLWEIVELGALMWEVVQEF